MVSVAEWSQSCFATPQNSLIHTAIHRSVQSSGWYSYTCIYNAFSILFILAFPNKSSVYLTSVIVLYIQ